MEFLENITSVRRKQRKAEKILKQDSNSSSTRMALVPETRAVDDSVMYVTNTDSHVAEVSALSEKHYKEHLELSMVEAFFLAYGVGCLQVLEKDGVSFTKVITFGDTCN